MAAYHDEQEQLQEHDEISICVLKWFTLMADKLGRPLEAVTVREYQQAFDRAELTGRGLDRAMAYVFGSIRFWSELNVDAIIERARQAEGQFRVEETPKLPRMDRDAQDRAAFDEWTGQLEEQAKAWALENPEEAAEIRVQVAAEFRQRFKVAKLGQLSPVAREMLKARLAMLFLQRRAGLTAAQQARMAGGNYTKRLGTPLSDESFKVVQSLERMAEGAPPERQPDSHPEPPQQRQRRKRGRSH